MCVNVGLIGLMRGSAERLEHRLGDKRRKKENEKKCNVRAVSEFTRWWAAGSSVQLRDS